jgi:hypothetical protein
MHPIQDLFFWKVFIYTIIWYAFLYALLFAQNFSLEKKWVLHLHHIQSCAQLPFFVLQTLPHRETLVATSVHRRPAKLRRHDANQRRGEDTLGPLILLVLPQWETKPGVTR